MVKARGTKEGLTIEKVILRDIDWVAISIGSIVVVVACVNGRHGGDMNVDALSDRHQLDWGGTEVATGGRGRSCRLLRQINSCVVIWTHVRKM